MDVTKANEQLAHVELMLTSTDDRNYPRMQPTAS